METYFNTIPVYQILILLLVGVILHFVFLAINTYIFPLKQNDKMMAAKPVWQRVQIIIWIAYALLFFTILFYENKLITTVISAIIIGVGWNYWRNVFSGILIKLYNHLRVGDFIENDFVSGSIRSIKLSHTKLLNESGETVVIPNSKLTYAVRKLQKQKNDYNTHVFMVKNDKLNYDEIYKIALRCPYISANHGITLERVQDNEFRLKASLIDISFVDKAADCFE